MAGILEIETLLKSMSPEIQNGEFTFCTVDGNISDYVHLNPLGMFQESEGLTLILTIESAKKGL